MRILGWSRMWFAATSPASEMRDTGVQGAAAWHRHNVRPPHRARGGMIARFAVFQLYLQRAFVAPPHQHDET